MLGDGWYKGSLAWKNRRNVYGEHRAALLELHIRYQDGTEDRILSGEGWKASTGAIQYSDIYHGETYDARLAQTGWSTSGFDDSAWADTAILSR